MLHAEPPRLIREPPERNLRRRTGGVNVNIQTGRSRTSLDQHSPTLSFSEQSNAASLIHSHRVSRD
jgi:hypothetical protein